MTAEAGLRACQSPTLLAMKKKRFKEIVLICYSLSTIIVLWAMLLPEGIG